MKVRTFCHLIFDLQHTRILSRNVWYFKDLPSTVTQYQKDHSSMLSYWQKALKMRLSVKLRANTGVSSDRSA